MLFDNAKVFIELSDEQEKQKLKQVLAKNGATILDKTEDSTNYFHVLDRSNWVCIYFSDVQLGETKSWNLPSSLSLFPS